MAVKKEGGGGTPPKSQTQNTGTMKKAPTVGNEQQAGYNYMGSYGPGATAAGPGGGTVQQPVVTTGQDNGSSSPSVPEVDWNAIDRANRAKSDIAALEAYLADFGLTGILDTAKYWITLGYDYEAIKAMIRTTPQYAQRFPAMKALASKGRTISEADYIAYERNTAELERLYGLPAGMLTSKDMQTKLITNEVSAKELESRTIKASANQYDLPPQFRQMMKDYYGIDSGGLTAYFLDPDVAAPLLEKQFVSAQIGMEGAIRGLSVDSGMSEFLYQQGVDRANARQGFTQVAGQSAFESGKGETATQNDLVKSAFAVDPGAADKVRRIASSRVGAFAGGGGFANDKSGVSGLGSSSL